MGYNVDIHSFYGVKIPESKMIEWITMMAKEQEVEVDEDVLGFQWKDGDDIGKRFGVKIYQSYYTQIVNGKEEYTMQFYLVVGKKHRVYYSKMDIIEPCQLKEPAYIDQYFARKFCNSHNIAYNCLPTTCVQAG